MKIIDRIIFTAIAIALMLIAARPFYADALGHKTLENVNIAAVAGKELSFGDPIPVVGEPPKVGIPKPVR